MKRKRPSATVTASRDLDHPLRASRAGAAAEAVEQPGLDHLERREELAAGGDRHRDAAPGPMLAAFDQHRGARAVGVAEGAEIAHARAVAVAGVGDDAGRESPSPRPGAGPCR